MGKKQYWETVFEKPLETVDHYVADLIRLEEERQARKIVMIPSESICPRPVLEALGSAFNNIYAEGYIPSMMIGEDEHVVQRQDFQLARFRRYSDRRFYRGCDYTNLVEALAQRRAARLFATRKNPAGRLWVSVQPLSGAAANNAVYDAFVKPGDVVMGLNLMHGGHLTHGSEFNRSGKNYRIVSYEVSHATGRLDYDEILKLTREHKPKMIIAGYTSYPWAPDWKKFRKAADEAGAILLADISHTAGLVVAGAYPNPVDYADVVTCTTHKTLFGPRGAIMITADLNRAEVLEQSVFPGEQGGPHVNKFAAMAVAFGIAAGDEYKRTQRMIVKNAGLLGRALEKEGLSLAYGGTDTHLLLVDCGKIKTKSGYPLKGEIAVRILDLCGIVANKNTIPGDTVTAEASGVRLGTPWITQRGITPEGIEELGSIIAHILKNISPFTYIGLTGDLPRGKIAPDAIREAQERVDGLVSTLASERFSGSSGYPYIGYESGDEKKGTVAAESGSLRAVTLHGERVVSFLEQVTTGAVRQLGCGEGCFTFMLDAHGGLLAPVYARRVSSDGFRLICRAEEKRDILVWLRGLSDGYVMFDEDDIFKKVEGPVLIEDMNGTKHNLQEADLSALTREGYEKGTNARALHRLHPEGFDLAKPYFIGQLSVLEPEEPGGTRRFSFAETNGEQQSVSRASCLYDEHKKLTSSFVDFGGWKMPVRYKGIVEEHRAVRTAAGIFDISHMGIVEVSGEHATHFLDCITSNYVPWIKDGESQYSYLLDPEGNVIDDIMVYRMSWERYIVIVNAVNAEKDLTWMIAVNAGKTVLDPRFPLKRPGGEVAIRDLKDPASGKDRLVNIALQGPLSLSMLLKIRRSRESSTALVRIKKTCFDTETVGGIPLVISRTGYTGEETGFELLVHPDRAPDLWRMLVDAGAVPVGLGARDSLRIEAGLPLYGHELGGPRNISPPEAGFGPYVKFHKPFFVGRDPLFKKTESLKTMIARFRMNRSGVRIAKQGDIVVSKRGQKMIGEVTSCALGTDGVQVGMALVDKRFARARTLLGIIPRAGLGDKLLSDTGIGDRVTLHEEATVIVRFPEEE